MIRGELERQFAFPAGVIVSCHAATVRNVSAKGGTRTPTVLPTGT
jgi:hypothetical protein